jgi:hypothetical protein
VKQSVGASIHTGAQTASIHKYRKIVSRLLEHGPQVSHGDLELLFEWSLVLAGRPLIRMGHRLDSDALSVDSEGIKHCRPGQAERDRQEDRRWMFKRTRNRVKVKR